MRVKHLILILAVLLCGQYALAQEEAEKAAAGSYSMMWEVYVDMNDALAFEAAMKEHVQFCHKIGFPWEWNTWRVVNGNKYGNYAITSPDRTLADIDEYTTKYTNQVMHFNMVVAPLVKKMTRKILMLDVEHSRLSVDMAWFKLISVTEFKLKPDGYEAFAGAVAKYHAAIEKADMPHDYFSVYWVHNGGYQPGVYIVFPIKNYQGLAVPERTHQHMVIEEYGEEAAKKLSESFMNSIASMEDFILELRDDLSYVPMKE